MNDWLAELDDFAKRYRKGILPDAGMVSHQAALAKEEAEYAQIHRKMIHEPSPAERDFWASMKDTQKLFERKTK